MAVQNYFTDASQKLLVDHELIDKYYETNTDVEALLSTSLAQEILSDKGENTYLMHGTDI